MTSPATPEPGSEVQAPRRARMGRYALWQLRDYVVERGLPTVVVSSLFGFLGAMEVRDRVTQGMERMSPGVMARYGSAAAAESALLADASTNSVRSSIGAIVFLGALFAMNGLVANDRKQGFYKFLFSKPVTPERYYGQAFVLHAAGFAAAVALLGLLWGHFVHPVLRAELLGAMFLIYLCYAGIAFFLTAAAKWDWLSLVAVALTSTVLWGRFGDSPSPLAKLLYLLPPLTRVDSVYAAVMEQRPLPWPTLAWLAGYGLVAYAAGLVVLRHRRLATP